MKKHPRRIERPKNNKKEIVRNFVATFITISTHFLILSKSFSDDNFPFPRNLLLQYLFAPQRRLSLSLFYSLTRFARASNPQLAYCISAFEIRASNLIKILFTCDLR